MAAYHAPMDDRITSLEEKFAFLEHQVEQLDGVIRDAFERLDGLARELQQTRASIQHVETRLDESGSDEDPRCRVTGLLEEVQAGSDRAADAVQGRVEISDCEVLDGLDGVDRSGGVGLVSLGPCHFSNEVAVAELDRAAIEHR